MWKSGQSHPFDVKLWTGFSSLYCVCTCDSRELEWLRFHVLLFTTKVSTVCENLFFFFLGGGGGGGGPKK